MVTFGVAEGISVQLGTILVRRIGDTASTEQDVTALVDLTLELP
jgi:predicted phosphoribosyltransferase